MIQGLTMLNSSGILMKLQKKVLLEYLTLKHSTRNITGTQHNTHKQGQPTNMFPSTVTVAIFNRH